MLCDIILIVKILYIVWLGVVSEVQKMPVYIVVLNFLCGQFCNILDNRYLYWFELGCMSTRKIV